MYVRFTVSLISVLTFIISFPLLCSDLSVYFPFGEKQINIFFSFFNPKRATGSNYKSICGTKEKHLTSVWLLSLWRHPVLSLAVSHKLLFFFGIPKFHNMSIRVPHWCCVVPSIWRSFTFNSGKFVSVIPLNTFSAPFWLSLFLGRVLTRN